MGSLTRQQALRLLGLGVLIIIVGLVIGWQLSSDNATDLALPTSVEFATATPVTDLSAEAEQATSIQQTISPLSSATDDMATPANSATAAAATERIQQTQAPLTATALASEATIQSETGITNITATQAIVITSQAPSDNDNDNNATGGNPNGELENNRNTPLPQQTAPPAPTNLPINTLIPTAIATSTNDPNDAPPLLTVFASPQVPTLTATATQALPEIVITPSGN